MPTLTIDGKQVTVSEGATVIQAAEKLGIFVPRYCYHPGLRIAGSCRMCLVEIEKMPKLQISCYTRVQEGMVVHTQSEKARWGRKSMLEFLLINHPLDCPVCDQSGECDLQNFYMEFGQYQSRFLEDKIKRKKAYPLGPHVNLDQERCILCTRCSRFTEDVSKTHELGVFNRGNRSVIDLFPGRTLDNPYSGNVIDICPVGALTEREFRFQCRVWYLQTQQSICTGCSRGCNISIHYNNRRIYKAGGKRVQRLKPRFNPEVNQWWICDQGRFGYEFIDQNRIEEPFELEDGKVVAAEWESALSESASMIRQALQDSGPQSVGLIVSPQLSNEELYLIRRLFVEDLGISNIGHLNPWEEKGPEDDFLMKADRNPNTRGAEELGLTGNSHTILEKAASGEIKVLYVFRHDFGHPEAAALLAKAERVIFQGVNWNHTASAASIILAGATHAEKDGTFTNFEGRIQRFHQAFLPLEDSKDDLRILIALAEKLGHPMTVLDAEEVFQEWQGLRYDEIDEYGIMLGEATTVGA